MPALLLRFATEQDVGGRVPQQRFYDRRQTFSNLRVTFCQSHLPFLDRRREDLLFVVVFQRGRHHVDTMLDLLSRDLAALLRLRVWLQYSISTIQDSQERRRLLVVVTLRD